MNSEKRDLLVMKLIHYFSVEKKYNPVIVHGIQNEIWLENMDEDIKIVRIVLNYIHNNEQLEFDNFKVGRLSSQIKKKTFTFKLKTLSFYLDINDDVAFPTIKNRYMVKVKSERGLKSNKLVKELFPDLPEKLIFDEKGAMLYEKINNDILRSNLEENEKISELFSEKKPITTYILMFIMCLVFMLMYVFGNGSTSTSTLFNFGALVKPALSPIRTVTSIFLHIGFIHLFMNMWAFNILGKQNENFYGHFKMLIIFLYSGIVGNLLSLIFMGNNSISSGASGAIFGLMGSLLYFAINQRTYMTEALKRDIIPVIIINIIFSFMIPSINLYAHIGGLLGGMLAASAVGIKYKSSKFERLNGIFASIILVGALFYIVYFR